MTKSEQAMRMALEALTNAYWPTSPDSLPAHNIKECSEAIDALRQALEPQMRPATRAEKIVKPGVYEVKVEQQPADELLRLRDLLGKANALARIRANEIESLKAKLKAIADTQPAERTANEPVAFFDPQGKGFYWAKPTKITAPSIVNVEHLPLYTRPQPAAWVGLTDEDFQPMVFKAMRYYGYDPKHSTLTSGAGFYELVRAIEAKLKEKNT